MQTMMKEPKESQGYNNYERYKEDKNTKSIFDIICKWFAPEDPIRKKIKSQTEYTTSSSTNTTIITSSVADPLCDISEQKGLTVEEIYLLDGPTIDFLSQVQDLIKSDNLSCDVVYDKLYNNMPQEIVTTFTSAIKDFKDKLPDLFDDNKSYEETYEEIMKRFMKYSANEKLNLTLIITDSRYKLINTFIKAINLFKEDKYSTIDEDVFPLRPVVLAMLWALLMMELVIKYTSSCADFELEHIAKISLSIVISIIIGVTGYMHSGGHIGSLISPTIIINKCYKIQRSIEEHTPTLYNKIPGCLKFSNCEDFNSLIKEHQISTVRGLNMTYTFRVGDSLLHNLYGSKCLHDGIIKKIFTSLWPLPTEEEAKKMYQLYTDNKVYNL